MKYYKVELINVQSPRARAVWVMVRAKSQAEGLAIAEARCNQARNIHAPTGEIAEITQTEYEQTIKNSLR